MSKFINVNNQTIESIRDGLNELSGVLVNIDRVVGSNSSAITLDENGIVKVHSLAIGVNTLSENVNLETLGAVKFQGKKFEVGNQIPTIGFYNKGDIVWTDNPQSNGNVGWICIRTGTPGEWRTFGNIG
tara:strand:- start:532 stop:918 length:387 start_codon:yes stop_codon:yes gene_type:complete